MKQYKVKIFYSLETSDHDGYCSGNECNYTKKLLSWTGFLDKPPHYYDYNDLIYLLPEPDMNFNGSHYCQNSEKAIEKDLNKHESRCIIKRIVPLEDEEEVSSDYED